MVKIHIVAQTTRIRWTMHLSVHVSLMAKKIISCAIVLTLFARWLSELKNVATKVNMMDVDLAPIYLSFQCGNQRLCGTTYQH